MRSAHNVRGIRRLLMAGVAVAVVGSLGSVGFHSHLAGKPNGGTSSLSLVLVTDVNGDGLVNYGDTITYKVSTTVTSGPQVSTQCYQNGVLVLHGNAAFYDGNPFAYMDYLQLTSGVWTGGAADCNAVMYYNSHNKQVTLATLSFHVNA